MENKMNPAGKMNSLQRRLTIEKIVLNFGLYVAMLIVIFVFATLNSNYLTINNLLNIFEQYGYYLVCASGMTYVLLIGQFDLSAGGTLAFSTVIGAQVMIKSGSILQAMVVVYALAILIGLFNGLLVVKAKLPAFIVTIAAGYAVRGIVTYSTDSRTISGIPMAFTDFAWNRLAGIPILIIVALVIWAVLFYILRYTAYGRKIYACGGNETCARISGVNTDFVRMSVYVISACCFATGGMMVMSRSSIARSSTLPNLQMECIAAAVIGGTSLTGGSGSLAGTLVGVVLLSMINSGLNALGVDAFWQQILTGTIIICSALMDSYKTRNNA